jgi:N-acetylglucosaminyl-diphospho-decaprenol L-rhamnosyltransferase
MEAVVVTYNSAASLRRFVASRATMESFSRIIVVDNVSTDDTCEIAASAGLDVRQLRRNLGFGGAANLGISATDGDVVALLNPDVLVPEPSAIDRLAWNFDDFQVAVAAPALMLPDGSIQDSARFVPTPANLVQRRFVSRRAGSVDVDAASDVAWVVGAAMLIRKAAFYEIAGFDPRYHIYFEDVDLSVRLRRRGWVIRYDPNVTLVHEHAGASRQSFLAWSTRQHMLSACRFYARNPGYVVSKQTFGTPV